MSQLQLPPFFNPQRVGEVWRVPYQERAGEARKWADEYDIFPAARDEFKIALVAVDVQNTFCIPDFELYVAGRSGTGAIDDNRRLVEFIYQNLHRITTIYPTMDTHQAMQIFHALFLIDENGNHPAPLTLISRDDVESGRWQFNPKLAVSLEISPELAQRHLEHYVGALSEREKYDLTIWPYHAMLGGIGHALVSAVEEAIFFHSIARYSQAPFQVKGDNPFTEHYSVLGPEVAVDPRGESLIEKNEMLISRLMAYDAVIIAGQAKSHCVAWTIDDLLRELGTENRHLTEKVYLLEDCTSPVVVPDVVDYTDEADAAFQRFADAGMHVVRSTEPIEAWPGIHLGH